MTTETGACMADAAKAVPLLQQFSSFAHTAFCHTTVYSDKQIAGSLTECCITICGSFANAGVLINNTLNTEIYFVISSDFDYVNLLKHMGTKLSVLFTDREKLWKVSEFKT